MRSTDQVEAQSSLEASESSDDAAEAGSQGNNNGGKKKWIPKPVSDISSEPSEGNSSDEDREFIYTQVCRKINQLSLELDKLHAALPACEAFIQKFEKKRQVEVMNTRVALLKDDQVPVIQIDCKVSNIGNQFWM